MTYVSRAADSLKDSLSSFHHVVPGIELRLLACQQAFLPTESPVPCGAIFKATFSFILEEGCLSPAIGGWLQSHCQCWKVRMDCMPGLTHAYPVITHKPQKLLSQCVCSGQRTSELSTAPSTPQQESLT